MKSYIRQVYYILLFLCDTTVQIGSNEKALEMNVP